MRLHQRIPGAISVSETGKNHSEIFSVGFYQGKTYLAYGSNASVVILSHSLQVEQILVTRDRVVALAWSGGGGLAIGTASGVECWEHGTHHWACVRHTLTPGGAQAVAWHRSGAVLTGGAHGLRWVWLPPLPSDSSTAEPHSEGDSFSCHSGQIDHVAVAAGEAWCWATAGPSARLVKVWTAPRGPRGPIRVAILPHPRGVTGLQWGGAEGRVLLTGGRDGKVRLWIPATAAGRLWSVGAIIPTCSESPVFTWLPSPSSPSSPSTLPLLESRITHFSTTPLAHQSSVHWIVTVGSMGSPSEERGLIFWKVKGLADRPKRTPSVAVWSRVPLTSSSPSQEMGVVALGAVITAMGTDSQGPTAVRVWTVSGVGWVTGWSCLRLPPHPTLSGTPEGEGYGHVTTITALLPHPSAPLVASVEAHGTVILWKATEPRLVEAPLDLQPVARIPSGGGPIAWAKTRSVLAIGGREGVTLYRLEGKGKGGVAPWVTLPYPPGRGQQTLEKVEILEDEEGGIVLGVPPSSRGNGGEDLWVWPFPSLDSSAPAYPQQYAFPSPLTHWTFLPLPGPSQETTRVLLTGHVDGRVRLWERAGGRGWEVTQVEGPLHSLAGGPFGLVAVHVSSEFRILQLSVPSLPPWDQLFPTWECQIPITASPTSFAWLDLLDGSAALAVSHGSEVQLYYKRIREDFGTFGVSWEALPLPPSPFPLEHLGWTVGGSLVGAGGSQLVVYSKWSEEGKNRGERDLDCPTILHYLSALQRPLPFYHPQVLLHLLLGGEVEKVSQILRLLLTTLRERTAEVPWLSLDTLTLPPPSLIPQPDAISSGRDTAAALFDSPGRDTAAALFDEPKKDTAASLFDEPRKDTAAALFDEPTKDTAASLFDEPTKNSTALADKPTEVEGPRGGVGEGLRSEEVKELIEHFSTTPVPLVSGVGQLHLSALTEALGAQVPGLDPPGGRCAVALRAGHALRRLTPGKTGPSGSTTPSVAILWATLSEAEDVLVQQAIPGPPTWEALRDSGIPIWVRSEATLRKLVEGVGQTRYRQRKDVEECALWYLALNKRSALAALSKASQRKDLAAFFGQDFTLPKWQTGALKNAYALLGKQRWELAVAFFLLGGAVEEAVGLCRQKLRDPALALLLTRLLGVGEARLTKEWAAEALEGGDRCLAAALLWRRHDYSAALSALLPAPLGPSPLETAAPLGPADPWGGWVMGELRDQRGGKGRVNGAHQRAALEGAAQRYGAAGYPFLALQTLRALGPQGAQALPRSFRVRLALQLGALALGPSTPPQALGESLRWVAETLGVSLGGVLLPLLRFADLRSFVGAQQLLLGLLHPLSPAVAKEHVLGTAWSLRQLWSLPTLSVSFAQSRWAAQTAVQVSLCLAQVDMSANVDIAPNTFVDFGEEVELFPKEMGGEERLVRAAVRVGIFVGAAMMREWKVLLAVVTETEIQGMGENAWWEGPPPSPLPLSSEDDLFDFSLPVQEFLWELILYLLCRRFYLTLEDVEEAATGLTRWMAESKGRLWEMPLSMEEKWRENYGPEDLLLLLNDYVEHSPFARSPAFLPLWEALAQPAFLLEGVTDLPFSRTFLRSDPRSYQLTKFTEPEIIYKDRDILQSLCVNAANPLQIAMATTRGIREIALSKDRTLVPLGDAEGGEERSHSDSEGGGESEERAKLSSSSNSSSSSSPFKRLRAQLHRSDSALGPFPILNKRKKDSGSQQIDHNTIVQWLESHPVFPYCGVDGTICLWQYNASEDLESFQSSLMATYRLAPNPRVTRIHFNTRGTKFGACDSSGKLALWRFDANEASLLPFHTLQCHSNTLDFAFMNSGSMIATAGISSDKRNVCIWDTLLPPSRTLVCSFSCHEGGASSVIYSPRHQVLITGGKKGDLILFDVRQQRMLSQVSKAHTMNLKSLALDQYEEFFVTGSSDGNVKAWTLPDVQPKETWDDVHAKQTFVRKPGVFAPVSTYGVMQVLLDSNNMFSCGSDGRLLRSSIIR